VANHLEGFATLSRCSTPTPGVAVTVVSVVDQSAVTAQATAMTGALSISTTLASVTSWAMSNSESVVRDFGDGQGITVNPGNSIGVLVADGSNGGEFSVNIWFEE